MTQTVVATNVIEDSGVPLYIQIKDIFRKRIESGELAPGGQIPTEPELQVMFNVSRFTVRQAVEGLLLEGLVTRMRGKGTFVAFPKIEESLPNLVSFSEEMRQMGKTPSTEYQHVEIVPPSAYIREMLRLSDTDDVLRIKRVRCGDGIPLALLMSHLPVDLLVDPGEDFSGSLWELLQAKYNIRIARGDQIIEAVMSDEEQSELLRVPRRSPLLMIRRIAYTYEDKPVEYVEGFYPADRYSYKITLSRT